MLIEGASWTFIIIISSFETGAETVSDLEGIMLAA